MYFDGHCNLCNRFVDFIIRRDRRQVFKFASLQGVTAKSRLPVQLLNPLSSMVLESEAEIITESSAAIKTIVGLGGVYTCALAFLLLPKFLRDWIYRRIAQHRYWWFGRRETCRVPSPQERARFLP